MLLCDPDIGFPSLLILDSPTFIPDTIYHGIHRNSSILKVCKMLASLPASPGLGKKEQFFPAPAWQASLHPTATPGCTPAPSVETLERRGLFSPHHGTSTLAAPGGLLSSWDQPQQAGTWGSSTLLGPGEQPQPPHLILTPHRGPSSSPKSQQSRGPATRSPGLGGLPAPACP